MSTNNVTERQSHGDAPCAPRSTCESSLRSRGIQDGVQYGGRQLTGFTDEVRMIKYEWLSRHKDDFRGVRRKPVNTSIMEDCQEVGEAMDREAEMDTNTQVRQNPYENLTPKGKKQVQKFLNVNGKVSIGNKGLYSREIKIILKEKGKFDTLTTGAIEAIKARGGAIRCEVTTQGLPKSLKKQKKVKFSKAYCEIKIRGHVIKMNPKIIEAAVICVTLGQKSINKIRETILCAQDFSGADITRNRRGAKI